MPAPGVCAHARPPKARHNATAATVINPLLNAFILGPPKCVEVLRPVWLFCSAPTTPSLPLQRLACHENLAAARVVVGLNHVEAVVGEAETDRVGFGTYFDARAWIR